MTPSQVITPGAASHTGVSSMNLAVPVVVDQQNPGLELREVGSGPNANVHNTAD